MVETVRVYGFGPCSIEGSLTYFVTGHVLCNGAIYTFAVLWLIDEEAGCLGCAVVKDDGTFESAPGHWLHMHESYFSKAILTSSPTILDCRRWLPLI